MTCGPLPKKATRRSPAGPRGHLIEESGGSAGKKGTPDGAASAPGPGSTQARAGGELGKTGEDLESGRQGTT